MRCRGFTLVELVITLVVLSVLALGVSSYLGIGARMYSEAAEREQVLGQSRFVAERLVRELRNALPNSVAFSATSNCLEFLPVLYSGVYLSLPFEQAQTSISVISPDLLAVSPTSYSGANRPRLVVYPTNNNDVYGSANPGSSMLLNSISTEDASQARFRLNFASFRFRRQSPEQRFYISGDVVRYCLVNTGPGQFSLQRNGVLMAEGLRSANVFSVSDAVLNRNAVVNVLLQFGSVNNPDMFFNYEVHLANVP
jgi:MSHA biogenesis protein MshO